LLLANAGGGGQGDDGGFVIMGRNFLQSPTRSFRGGSCRAKTVEKTGAEYSSGSSTVSTAVNPSRETAVSGKNVRKSAWSSTRSICLGMTTSRFRQNEWFRFSTQTI
jgi:hypothetical protein